MQQKETLDSITTIARGIMPLGAQVFLYGSHARGDARSDSDWDVLVLLNKEKVDAEDFNRYCYPLYELGWNIGEEINPVMYTIEEWNNHKGKSLFYYNVEKDAIRLC